MCNLYSLLALLSGTLKTFQAYACDDETLNINCPHGTTVNVQLAQYGRQAVSNAKVCTPKPIEHEDNNNSSCLGTSTLQYNLLQVVVEQCSEKRQCKIPTSPTAFGPDPCPGIRKYVEVAYKCRPKEFITKVACEGEKVLLRCRKGTRIAIFSASYGRGKHSSVECPQADGVPEEECQSSYSTEAVIRICHGKQKCTMMADIQTFGNPCDEKSRRYLKIVFTCVPTRVLKSMYQNAGEEDYDGEGGVAENEGEEEFVDEPGYKPPISSKEDSEKQSVDPKKKSEMSKAITSFLYPNPTVQISTSKDVQGDDSEEELGQGSKGGSGGITDDANCTVAVQTSRENEDVSINVLSEWISAFNFLRGNKEKLVLYVSVSIAAGLVVFMCVVIARLIVQKRRERKKANLNITEPLPNGFSDDMSDVDQDITDLSHSSPPNRPDPSVSVVRYTSHSTMRRQDSDTNPRAPLANRSHNNFYYG
ncbi:hypothetical protein CHUAL_011114 [Chamberlinius hualienensis]